MINQRNHIVASDLRKIAMKHLHIYQKKNEKQKKHKEMNKESKT